MDRSSQRESLSKVLGTPEFYPLGGILLCDRQQIDLFRVDVAMLKLREQINSIREQWSQLSPIWARAGGQQLIQLLRGQVGPLAQHRVNWSIWCCWLAMMLSAWVRMSALRPRST